MTSLGAGPYHAGERSAATLVTNQLNAGEQLDHYRLEALVARSGMASIFRATDIRTGEPVAIKIPHSEAECDLAFYERFEREGQIGRELDHPAIVKVLEPANPSRVYLVLEWAEGRLLREILADEGKLDAPRALRIACAVCEALEYIHARGVIHRDLKPENIMIGPGDRVKLIDFGIAGKSGARRLTFGKLSNIMGTAEYIAPEQVNGKRGDARSDIYALGVILFEMLTGTVPFSGPNPLAVMNARLQNEPMQLREADPALSPRLENVLLRALQREPKNRYQSAAELAAELEDPCRARVPNAILPPVPRPVLFYSTLAAIPVTIFLLLLYVARHQ